MKAAPSPPRPSVDPRLEEILELLARMAAGDRAARAFPGDEGDHLDAILIGLNLLQDQLGTADRARHRRGPTGSDTEDAYRLSPAAFCTVTGPERRIALCNEALCELIGVGAYGLLDTPLSRYLESEPELVEQQLAAACRSTAPRTLELELSSTLGPRRVLARARAKIDDEDEEPSILLAMLDVTESRRLEEALRQARRVDALGRLAGGVAHDVNNLLQAALTALHLAEDPPEGGDEDEPPPLQIVEEAVTRAATLTRRLLSAGRLKDEEPQRFDLVAQVRQLLPLLTALVEPRGRLLLRGAPDEALVRAIPAELEQVLVNLVTNAHAAIAEGGRVGLRIEARAEGEGGPEVRLSVDDDGAGIPPGLLPRIFDPFFTTGGHERTGMGLASCRSIVSRAGGRIDATSAEGESTCFTVVLPAAGPGERDGSGL